MGAILVKSLDTEALKEQQTGQHQFSEQQWEHICQSMALSSREELVCRLLCDGHTRAVIAESMNVTPRTVRHHMERIHRRLGVHNRVGVVLRLIQLRDTIPTAVPPAPSVDEHLPHHPPVRPQQSRQVGILNE